MCEGRGVCVDLFWVMGDEGLGDEVGNGDGRGTGRAFHCGLGGKRVFLEVWTGKIRSTVLTDK